MLCPPHFQLTHNFCQFIYLVKVRYLGKKDHFIQSDLFKFLDDFPDVFRGC